MNETFNYIKKLVEKETGVADISVNSRKRHIVESRAVYYKLCRVFLPKRYNTLSVIGDTVNRDHASVLHGLKLFDSFSDKKHFVLYRKAYDKLFKILKSTMPVDVLDNIDMIDSFIENLSKENVKLKTEYLSIADEHQRLKEKYYKLEKLKLTKETLLKVEMLDIDDYKDFLTRANAFLSMDRIKSKYDFLN